jgi:hypothetical protein
MQVGAIGAWQLQPGEREQADRQVRQTDQCVMRGKRPDE